MNVLLVYPGYPNTFWSFKYILQFISKKAAFPPLGLLTVASLLPEGWNKRLVDLNVRNLNDSDLEWADMVFMSAMIIQKKSAQEVIKRCNRKGIKVVAGGPAFTLQHEIFNGVDHFVLDEAEMTLPRFLHDLDQDNLHHIYSSEERPDITNTPAPMWQLIDFNDYASMAIQYSRGCPYNCEFCNIVSMNGRIPRTKAEEQMIVELQSLYDAGWKGPVFVVDDNFIGNKSSVKKLLPTVIKWQNKNGYPYQFFTEASINLADDHELMNLMSAANFNKVFVGLETPSVDGLKECGKFINVTRNLEESVKTIHRNGMQVMGGFIVGFDTDTELIFDQQISFIQKIGVVTAMVGMLNALPQTRLWKRLKAEDRLLEDTTGENTDGTVNFIPKLGTENLIEGYKKIISNIYSPGMYYQRINEFLSDYNPKTKAPLTWNDIIAFMRSIWKIGLLSDSRFHYWKLLFKTLLTKTRAFPIAVELAICGLHFETVSHTILSLENE